MDFPLQNPEGYRWHGSDAVQTAVLVPQGWVIQESTHGPVNQVLAAPPEFYDRGECRAALTLNAIANVSKAYGMTASVYGAQGIAKIKATHRTLFDVEQAPDVDMRSWVVRFRSVLSSPPRIVQRYMLAHDTSDLLRWCTFEAPESDWTQAWLVGEFILAHLCMVLPVDLEPPEGTSLH